MTWTDEKVTELLRLRTEGLSRSQMATVLGTSRGAVFGKLWRLDKKQPQGKRAKPERSLWDKKVQVPYAVWKAERQKERELGLR